MHDERNRRLYVWQKLKDLFTQIIIYIWKEHNNKILFQTKDDVAARSDGNGSNREEFIIWQDLLGAVVLEHIDLESCTVLLHYTNSHTGNWNVCVYEALLLFIELNESYTRKFWIENVPYEKNTTVEFVYKQKMMSWWNRRESGSTRHVQNEYL